MAFANRRSLGSIYETVNAMLALRGSIRHVIAGPICGLIVGQLLKYAIRMSEIGANAKCRNVRSCAAIGVTADSSRTSQNRRE